MFKFEKSPNMVGENHEFMPFLCLHGFDNGHSKQKRVRVVEEGWRQRA